MRATVTQIGHSTGLTLSKEAVGRLKVKKGDMTKPDFQIGSKETEPAADRLPATLFDWIPEIMDTCFPMDDERDVEFHDEPFGKPAFWGLPRHDEAPRSKLRGINPASLTCG